MRLLRYILETVTKEGDLVLDPFVGTGTTAVACKQMKRHYIGIDKDPKYTQIANDRLKDKAAAKEDNEPAGEKAISGEGDTGELADQADDARRTNESADKTRGRRRTAVHKGAKKNAA